MCSTPPQSIASKARVLTQLVGLVPVVDQVGGTLGAISVERADCLEIISIFSVMFARLDLATVTLHSLMLLSN